METSGRRPARCVGDLPAGRYAGAGYSFLLLLQTWLLLLLRMIWLLVQYMVLPPLLLMMK